MRLSVWLPPQIIASPGQFEWKIYKYNDITVPLARSDLDVMSGKAEPVSLPGASPLPPPPHVSICMYCLDVDPRTHSVRSGGYILPLFYSFHAQIRWQIDSRCAGFFTQIIGLRHHVATRIHEAI